jgi:hypothetical protein
MDPSEKRRFLCILSTKAEMDLDKIAEDIIDFE